MPTLKINRILNPVVPRNRLDPASQFGNLRRAKTQVNKRFTVINQQMREMILNLNPTVKTGNEQITPLTVNKNVYEYQIDPARFSAIDLFIKRLLNEQILDNPLGNYTNQWWLNNNLTDAYVDGMGDIIQSAKNVTAIEVVGPQVFQQVQSLSVESEMFSQGVQNRLGLVYGRVFNEMEGLSSTMKTDLAGTLARGMKAGKGVRALAKDVTERVGVGHSRAMRIVRTEVLNSYRTATNEETNAINDDIFGDSEYKMATLWWSALAPTSRSWHIARHGELYTTQDVETFYSVNGNAINCLCSQSVVLQNRKTGKVLQQKLLDRMDKQKKAYQATHAITKK